jgi:hypothetical protein
MRNRLRSTRRCATWPAGLLALAALLLANPGGPAAAQPKRPIETFTATTAGMTPTGLGLRIQIIGWSDENARADVVAALGDAPALARLPTVGYVWPAGSPVGYTVKYAHRTAGEGGGERITLVTDKALGSFDFKKWGVTGAAAPAPSDRTYSVIELDIGSNGQGTGTFSLASDVAVDEAGGTVGLVRAAGGTPLLAEVRRQPPT